MRIIKHYDLFRLENENKLIEVLPFQNNIVWLCEKDKKIETFYFTKRVELNLTDLPEYEIALVKCNNKTKQSLMDKVIEILNKFNNDKNVQKYLVV
jgi:tRNA A37 threonylcarbamoyladenosine biosynthesis protein TsaE